MKKSKKRFLVLTQVLGWSALLASACTDEQVKNVSQVISSTNKDGGTNSGSSQDQDANSKSSGSVNQTNSHMKMDEKSQDSPSHMNTDLKGKMKTQGSGKSQGPSAKGGATTSGEGANTDKGENQPAGAPNSDTNANTMHKTSDGADHIVNTGGKKETKETTLVSEEGKAKSSGSKKTPASTAYPSVDPSKQTPGTGSVPEESQAIKDGGQDGKPAATKPGQETKGPEAVAQNSPGK